MNKILALLAFAFVTCFLVFTTQSFAQDGYVVLGEGVAYSYVAEYVVINQARLRMTDSARVQCRQAGFSGKIDRVKDSGSCQSWYRNRVWQAMCSSEFYCR